jgi:probable F420-dependent oxidoreductase
MGRGPIEIPKCPVGARDELRHHNCLGPRVERSSVQQKAECGKVRRTMLRRLHALQPFAYLAGVTKMLELVTGVIILPQRQTALFAKQAADVDLFSDGRLRLGVGIGWNWVEFDGLEMSRHFRRRGRRQELQIALIRKLWEQPVVDHEDADHRIDRAGILPRPKRPIPIWLGGFSEAAYDRAARIGDGFLFSGRTQTEAAQIKARIEVRLRELGRDVDAFSFESVQQYSRGDNQWPRDIAAWREAGESHISVVTMGANLTTVDGHIEAIKALAGCLQLGPLELWRMARPSRSRPGDSTFMPVSADIPAEFEACA